ncbi:MAG: hypothetical protein GX265_02905 [Mollicutes bacterium]|nr:hypothetical protein [Mollicutes bacterium]
MKYLFRFNIVIYLLITILCINGCSNNNVEDKRIINVSKNIKFNVESISIIKKSELQNELKEVLLFEINLYNMIVKSMNDDNYVNLDTVNMSEASEYMDILDKIDPQNKEQLTLALRILEPLYILAQTFLNSKVKVGNNVMIKIENQDIEDLKLLIEGIIEQYFME